MKVASPIVQGATVPQARAALRQYKDVMQAAERIFEGQFDNVPDEEDTPMDLDIDNDRNDSRRSRRLAVR